MHQDARAADRDVFARQAARERLDRTPAAGRTIVVGEFGFVFHDGFHGAFFGVQI
jgi:hypothetical protein